MTKIQETIYRYIIAADTSERGATSTYTVANALQLSAHDVSIAIRDMFNAGIITIKQGDNGLYWCANDTITSDSLNNSN